MEEEERRQKQREEEQKQREEQRRIEELRQSKLLEAEQKKLQLPAEPDAKDPNTCHIVFRLPVSGERTERRFLKTEQVQTLYDFIDSLGEKVQFESPHGNGYTIFQSMPRKEFSSKGKTLAEEGLFPRAML